MSVRTVALPIAFLLVFAFLQGANAPVLAQEESRATVRVGGEGTVRTAPDQAVVRFGIVSRAETAEEARSQNATAARNAMNAVRELDIPEEDMRMETLRLQPRREYNRKKQTYEEKGYEATRLVVVELDTLDVLPQLIAEVVQRGANRLEGINYQLSDRESVRNEALRRAAQAARGKAQLLTETLEAQLGEVYQINEQSFDFVEQSPQPRMMKMSEAAQDEAEPEPEAYAAGEIEVTAQVEVIFNLVNEANR